MEVEYFLALASCEQVGPLRKLNVEKAGQTLRRWIDDFSEGDAQRVKEIEKVTNHDLKAVEYWIKEKMKESEDFGSLSEFVHFGLTSQDINNTCIPLLFKESMNDVIVPAYRSLLDELRKLAIEWMEIPMLAHTHGQPATPTRVGKEFMVFVERLERQLTLLEATPYEAKFGGATGGFNAHKVIEQHSILFGNQLTRESRWHFPMWIGSHLETNL